MTTEHLIELGFTPATPCPPSEITGGFCGDLLSWVMGRAQEGQIWFTVMGNVNAVAVASLTGVAAIVLCNDAVLADDARARAEQQGIGFYTTSLPAYEAVVLFSKNLDKGTT